MPSQEKLLEPRQPSPNYGLSGEEAERLTKQLITERLPNTLTADDRFVTIELNPGSPFANIGRYIEGVVFGETFGNSAEMLEASYLPYEDTSRFFLSIDRKEGAPTGVLRVISNSSVGLMTMNDVESPPFNVSKQAVADQHKIDDFDTTWDIGTVAVLPKHRHGEGPVSIQLFRAMYKSALTHNIEHLLSMVDQKLYGKLTGILGIPFEPLAGSKPGPYMDSKKTQAVHGSVLEFYGKMLRHKDSFKGRSLARYVIGDSLERLVEGSKDSLIFLDELL